MLEKILEDEAKYEVEVAKGGFAAGVTAEKFRPHVILLDMHLKDIDGREVVQAGEEEPRPSAHQGHRDERQDDRRRGQGPARRRASTASSGSRSTSAR